MLGQPVSMLIPRVVGFKLSGELPEGVHGHRPRAHDHRDAAQARRGRQVRRVLRRRRLARCRWPTAPPSATCRPEFGSTIAVFPSTRRPSSTSSSPAAPRSSSSWSRPTPRSRACGTTRRPSRATPRGSSSTWPTSCRRWPGRSAPRTGSRVTDAKEAFRSSLADYVDDGEPEGGRDKPGVPVAGAARRGRGLQGRRGLRRVLPLQRRARRTPRAATAAAPPTTGTTTRRAARTAVPPTRRGHPRRRRRSSRSTTVRS